MKSSETRPSAPVMSQIVRSVGLVRVTNPPVNALSHGVRCGLVKELDALSKSEDVSGIVIIGAGNTFPAGADIKEFGSPIEEPQINTVNLAIEACSKPVIAAIHGAALGGGLEIAMTCHFRIAHAHARLGLPEVKLGLIPGAGGTQRLPRLIGAEQALRAIATSRIFSAAEAKDLGLIDRVVSGDLEIQALEFMRSILAGKLPLRLARNDRTKLAPLPDAVVAAFMTSLPANLKRRAAVRMAVESVRNSVELPFEEGLKAERECVAACKMSPQAAALQHVFFAERAALKVRGRLSNALPKQLGAIGMIGRTMRADLVEMAVLAGLQVLVYDPEPEAAFLLNSSLDVRLTKRAARKFGSNYENVKAAISLLKVVTTIEDLGPADIVLDLGPESLGDRITAVSALSEKVSDQTIIASVTAFSSVDRIADACKNAERYAAIHFFIPPKANRQLEVIRAEASGDATISILVDFCKRLGKLPVVIRDCDGFVGDSMLRAYLAKAIAFVEDGFPASRVDAALRDFGMALGPFETCRFVGLDIAQKILNGRSAGKPDNAGQRLLSLSESGALGNAAAAATSHPGDGRIAEECLKAAVLVGEQLLREGIVQRKSDIDMVWINGLGFPEEKGGPMYWAEFRVESCG